MNLDWEEETVYRAETPHFTVNVYRRTISRQWAFYIVNKKTTLRVAMKYLDYKSASLAKIAAGKTIKQLTKKEN